MKRKKPAIIATINVTSLVDVTMVLLIIFMIAAPLLRSGVEVNLPQASSELIRPHEGIVVTLAQTGEIYLDGDKIQLDNFEALLFNRYTAANKKTVLLQADKSIPYGEVVNLMDRIKGAGISNLGLIVETEKKN